MKGEVTALLTGFAPFGEWRINSSWEAARILGARRRDLTIACLPVAHEMASARIRWLVAEYRPLAILLTGLAPSPVPRLELHARHGPQPEALAQSTRVGRWPFQAAQRAIQSLGMPCRCSTDAGTYVCESIYWAGLGLTAPYVGGFLHLPPLGVQWTARRLSLVVEACLDTALQRVEHL